MEKQFDTFISQYNRALEHLKDYREQDDRVTSNFYYGLLTGLLSLALSLSIISSLEYDEYAKQIDEARF